MEQSFVDILDRIKALREQDEAAANGEGVAADSSEAIYHFHFRHPSPTQPAPASAAPVRLTGMQPMRTVITRWIAHLTSRPARAASRSPGGRRESLHERIEPIKSHVDADDLQKPEAPTSIP